MMVLRAGGFLSVCATRFTAWGPWVSAHLVVDEEQTPGVPRYSLVTSPAGLQRSRRAVLDAQRRQLSPA